MKKEDLFESEPQEETAVPAEQAEAPAEPDEAADVPAEEEQAAPAEDAAEEKAPRERKLHNKRRARIRATSIGITAVVAAVVIVLNIVVSLLADRYPLNLDLTEEAVYSLSQNSIDLAAQIDKDVEITFFLKDDLLKNPSTGNDTLDTVLRQMYTFSAEYASRCKSKIDIRFVDLTENPTLAGTYPVDVADGDTLFQCGERVRHFTIDDMLTYEQVPNYQTYQYDYVYYSTVEKTLATGFLSVVGDADMVLTFLTGNGESAQAIADMQAIYEDNGYTVKTLDFTTAAEIDEACTTMLIVGANIDFTDAQIERLTAWLNNGGKLDRHLYVLCDYAAGKLPNLYEFLETYYGIAVSDQIIYETDAGSLYDARYPYFPLATIQENELMPDATGKRVLLGATLALDTKLAHDPDNLMVFDTDIITFPNQTTKLWSAVVDENGAPVYDEDGNPTYEVREAAEYPLIGAALACEWDIVNNISVNSYVFVAGGYDFIGYVNYSSAFSNESLILDPINTMCGNLINVKVESQKMDDETLMYTAKTARVLGLGVFTIGVPVLLLVAGLLVFIRRRHL